MSLPVCAQMDSCCNVMLVLGSVLWPVLMAHAMRLASDADALVGL
jgi:hypothetical protein